ncbi:MAG: DUF2125 domain-containing protein [Proteobacteria bacterium]|nr:DUF2125 domain-containing protein [Pseudomonadota bacterium]
MRILYSSIAALILVIGGYVFWWFHVADTMSVLAENWKQKRLAEGYEISHGPLTTSGFPYRVRITAEDVTLSNPGHFQQPQVFLTRFWAVTQPWRINHVIFGVQGASRIDWLDKGQPKSLDLAAATAHGSATFNHKGRIQTVAVDLTDIQMAPSWRDPITAARIQIHGRPAPDTEESESTKGRDQQIAVRIDQMTIDGMDDFPLGKTIEKFALSTNLEGTIKKLPSAETLSVWRDQGGALDINSLKIIWGHGKIDGEGRLKIDQQNYPSGSLKTKISGYEKILEALTATGQVEPNLARTIGFALDLLAKNSDDGTKYLQLPVAAQEGGVYLGPLFLMRLQPLFKTK